MRKLLFVTLVGLAVFACDRPSTNSSSLSVRMPDLKELSRLAKSEKLSSMAQGEVTSLTDINCFIVVVGGPLPALSTNTCVTKDKSKKISFGPWVGGIPRGQGALIKVPSGADRVISLFGFKAEAGYCKDFRQNDILGSDKVTNFRVLAQKKVNLEPGDQTVSLKLASSVNQLPQIDPSDCDVQDTKPPGTPEPEIDLTPLWGDGSDGDIELTSSISAETISANGKLLQAYGRVTGVSSDGKVLSLGETLNSFSVGDRILFLVHAANDGSDPTAMDAVCGGGLHPGFYHDYKITDVDGSNVSIDKALTTNPATISSTALANDSYSSTDTFCRAQIVRQAQLKKLSIDPTGSDLTLSVPPFDGKVGGVLSFYVSDTLSFGGDPAYYVHIDASKRGLGGGTSRAGIGHQGDAGANEGLSSSGWAGVRSAAGGGGGANNGNGGVGNGHLAANDAVGGSAFAQCSGGNSCPPAERLLFGAGGGSGAGAGRDGGTGGGIVFIAARNIVIDNPRVYMSATGGDGVATEPGNTSQGGGGGGAGGSLLIKTEQIARGPTASGLLSLKLKAYGGNGGDVNHTSDGNGGGGGGGGTEIQFCADPNSYLSANQITLVSKVHGGYEGLLNVAGNGDASDGAAANGLDLLGFGPGDYSIVDTDLCAP